ncbi:ABC transporter permease [Carnobacterium divergens]|uniref:ABC transporter permease n=1 Tax=Carnobacterium divergens TaxID=2748 RepID=UPI0007F40BA3|nr:ABC transporter permease [Carnobacterium divergens]SBO18533.1 teichoic acid precursors permease [Carnobacterium divergens]
MRNIYVVMKEQLVNLGMIIRISKYEERATYQSHYLGLIWQILNPMIQIGIYYLIFGVGLHGGKKIEGTPYFVWLLIGIVSWFFIRGTLLAGSTSIVKKIAMVSKMKFPVSILPSIAMASQFVTYLIMMGVLGGVLFLFQIPITLYWLQYPYYLVAMLVFLYAVSLLNATITVLVRDYHLILQSTIQVLFYLSGVIIDIKASYFPIWLKKAIELNPLFYIIDGFRDTFLSNHWFWEKGSVTLFFWSLVGLFLLVGAQLHLRFRKRFIDYI